MRRLLFVATVVTLVTGLAASARAQPEGRGCGRCPMGGGGGMERMHHGGSGRMGPMGGMHGLLSRAEKLDLEKEQTEKIRDLATDWAVKRVDRTAALKKARLQLAEVLRADEVDMAEVEKRLDAVLQAQKDLKLGHFRHMTEVRKVLTDEQREKLGEGVMGCPMMGAHHGRKMRGRRGSSMMDERPEGRKEDHQGMHRGRGMHR